MDPHRRALLAAALAAPVMAGRHAAAQAPAAQGLGTQGTTAGAASDSAADWPQRAVRIILPAPGGGGTADTLARIFAAEAEKRLGQRVLIDNRGGANGNIGATAAARAAPDGHTFLWAWAGTLATNPALYRDLPFDPVRDFDPVLLLGTVPNVLVVNRQFGPRTLAEFAEHARANPGTINFGSTGNGSSMHLAGELYRQRTGVAMTHVPYNAPAVAMNDLLSNRIQAMFNLVTGAGPQIRAGEVVALGVLAERRVAQLPDVPTMAELGLPGLVFGTWFALLAPRGTDPAVLARMNALANAVLTDPAARARLEGAGLDILGGTAARLAAHLREEIASHAALVRQAGIRIE
jgi:tripartite-type tricarboxylate transporter receptor subunit TctC